MTVRFVILLVVIVLELELMAKAFEEAKLQDARMKKEIYKDHIEYLFASD